MTRAVPTTVVELVRRHALIAPERLALVCETVAGAREAVTFGALWRDVERYAAGLERQGIGRGSRVVLLSPLSPRVYALVLAMLGSGVTAVFLDAALRNRKGLVHALRVAKPKAVLTVAALANKRWLLPALWRARVYVSDRPRALCSRRFDELYAEDAPSFVPREFSALDEAFVTFTSGSTGKPKGVNRTQGVTLGQHRRIHAAAQEEPGEVHLTSLPVLALHNLSCGVTTLLAPLDPAKPTREGFEKALAWCKEYGATRVTGAPRFVVGLAQAALASGADVSSIRHVVTGAAPVTKHMCDTVLRAFPNARCQVAYGSTEAEPVSHVDMQEVLASEGRGYLVGHPVEATELELVMLPPALPELDERGLLPFRVADGSEGEVVVRGEQVVESYLDAPDHDQRLKLRDAQGRVWHRMGDTGYRDAQGRLWLTGRTADLVPRTQGALSPLPLEAELSDLLGGARAALIAHRHSPRGELVLEAPEAEPALLTSVRKLLDQKGLSDVAVHIVQELPLDPRHGSKLDRPRLRALREAAR